MLSIVIDICLLLNKKCIFKKIRNKNTHRILKKTKTPIKFELDFICDEEVIESTSVWCCNNQNTPEIKKKRKKKVQVKN